VRIVRAAKNALRAAIAAPGIRHGLRWFLQQPAIPQGWRRLVHRKLAKRAQFGDRTFRYTTPAGKQLELRYGGTASYLYWLGEYEPETTSVFCRLAARSQVVLDIGAADGLYAILAAAANPTARILAFEPGTQAAGVCGDNLALNRPLTRHVELHALALGAADAESTLYVAGETGGTSSLNPEFRADRREQRVVVRSGDSLLAELGIRRVDLIKLDTESTEPTVLRGLGETLRRDRPDVICEVLHGRSERELSELLAPLGYRFYWVSGRGLVRHAEVAGDPSYRHPNYLFSTRDDP
jgi:FkbM family methyltransferase